MLNANDSVRLKSTAEEMARIFVPRLNAYMRRQECSSASIMGGSKGEAWIEAYDQADLQSHALGWALGVLTAAAGVDALNARRERRGLELMLRAFGQSDASGWTDASMAALPDLRPGGDRGWETAFLFGWLCLREDSRQVDGPPAWKLERCSEAWELKIEVSATLQPGELNLGAARAWISASNEQGVGPRGYLSVPHTWLALSGQGLGQWA